MATEPERPAVSIIGFGRFGPVLSRLLGGGFEVLAYDTGEIGARAEEAGARVVSWDEATAAATIFVAVPIRRFKEVINDLVAQVKPGTTVLDVCSVKVYPATVMREYFQSDITTIASHPLFGPDSYTAGFQGLNMMMHPVSPRGLAYEAWTQYFSDQGLRVLEMSPEEHDRLAARSQGITHFIGRVLKEFGMAPTNIDTEGFRDLQMVVEQTCHDSFELFHDLENFNPYTTEMVADVVSAMEQVKLAIARRD
ncbi:MAG: prephenate dehydrogenase/arogenate dehydrogenase family protein [Candidatus Marinimicrobia bacterium]|nr:prephenate dehydrogenase/arogenate dehydrogenase family protein [Candidatus Neomarinimicrobiota bacterium]